MSQSTALAGALSRRGALRTAAAAAAAPTPASFLASGAQNHLLRRATYGPVPTTVAELQRVGTIRWLDWQLRPATIVDRNCDALLTRLPSLTQPIWKVRDTYSNGSWDLMQALTTATIVRATWSRRQLFEVMVELWSNHLNVTCPSSDVWDSRAHYDATIRRYALGRFSDLLVAATLHPAMLTYLDNASSTDKAPNENLGRELLELHTVGVGRFTETDVRNSARILTGLSVDRESGEFAYKPWNHFTGTAQVLGFRHANTSETGGKAVAVAYLRYLATHRYTATNVVTKLCRRFVSDNPPATLVNRLVAVYLKGDTAIAPVLKALLVSPEFRASAGAKTKRPYEDLVSTLRILQIAADARGTEGVEALTWMSQGLSHRPLAWHPPNGYPDVAGAWQSADSTLQRWNMHQSLVSHWWPAQLRAPSARSLLPAALPATHGALVDALSRRLVFRTLPSAHRAAVLAFIGQPANAPVTPSSAVVRWELDQVVALILDTPSFQLR